MAAPLLQAKNMWHPSKTQKSRIAQFKAAPTTFSCLEKTQKMEMQAVLKGLYHREVHDQEAFVHS